MPNEIIAGIYYFNLSIFYKITPVLSSFSFTLIYPTSLLLFFEFYLLMIVADRILCFFEIWWELIDRSLP